jgi:hypothetical protein
MWIGWRLVWIVILGACGRSGFDPIDAPPLVTPSHVDPTLWLPMDDDPPMSGNIVDRARGHAVRCLNDACPIATAGARGRGFLFSGVEQLQVDWTSDLDGRLGYTIAVWARLDRVPAPYACAFAEPNNTDAGDGDSFALCADSNDEIYVYATSAMADPEATLMGGPHARIDLDSWHHLAATWNPVLGRRILYVDGGSVAVETGGPALTFDKGALVVGADLVFSNGSGKDMYHWRGALDDLMFFPSALSDTEIQQLAAP